MRPTWGWGYYHKAKALEALGRLDEIISQLKGVLLTDPAEDSGEYLMGLLERYATQEFQELIESGFRLKHRAPEGKNFEFVDEESLAKWIDTHTGEFFVVFGQKKMRIPVNCFGEISQGHVDNSSPDCFSVLIIFLF